jgi:hypothetical protein
MEWIPNQPVFFGDDSCNDDEYSAVQLVDNTDTTQFQFRTVCEAGGIDLNIDAPDDGGWTWAGGWSAGPAGFYMTLDSASGNYPAYSDYSMSVGLLYTVVIDMGVVTSGGITVYFGGTEVGEITLPGLYTFTGEASLDGVYQPRIKLVPNDASSYLIISDVVLYGGQENIIVAVYNSEDQYQGQLNYTDNPESFVFANNTVTISVDWSELGLSNDCYYLCILDPCQNTNGQNNPPVIRDFKTNWFYGDDWTLNVDTFIGDYIDGDLLYQTNVFPSYSLFCMEVTAQNITGTVNVYFGENLVGTITTNGVTTLTGIPSGNFNLSFELESGSYVEITNVVPCATDPANYACDFTSNMFKVGDYSSACTIIINACNNTDGLGFVFEGSGFTPRVRLEAKLRQAKYSNDRSIYQDSIGEKSSYYFSGRKHKNLCIDLQPEYIHDFLRLLLGFDNVYLDSVSYIVDDDEYNVEYPESMDGLGKVKLLVSEKIQNVKKTSCTDEQNVCNLPPNYLLKADELSEFILLTNNEQILING